MGIILFNRVFHFRIATSGAIVSVPIRGLFNLTNSDTAKSLNNDIEKLFPSPSGDYLI